MTKLTALVLVVSGLVLLAHRVDMKKFWPLLLLGPALASLNVSLANGSKGGVVLTVGASALVIVAGILLQQAITDYFASWAYSWALVVPGALGGGLLLRHVMWRRPKLWVGAFLAASGATLFLIGLVVFEGIIGLSGANHPALAQFALSIWLLALGALLFGFTRTRSLS